MPCKSCGSGALDSDAAGGFMYCKNCGAVQEENAIVSELAFGESGSGAATLVGSMVSFERSGARLGTAGGNHFANESSEYTAERARQVARGLASALRLADHHVETSVRFFRLALVHNFSRGRKIQTTVAVCLYASCRLDRTSHMLIDFSDLIEVSVFVLGSAFMKLIKILHITQLPLVDPSIYISRFASHLGFGDKTRQVAETAVRLVTRMNRDWMITGRRPAGICGACLLIAARMHHFSRTITDIIHVVKMSGDTVRKRLEEFSATPSGKLTVAEFNEVMLEESVDPPAFKKARLRDLGNNEGTKDIDNSSSIRVRATTDIPHLTQGTSVASSQPTQLLTQEDETNEDLSKALEEVAKQADKLGQEMEAFLKEPKLLDPSTPKSTLLVVRPDQFDQDSSKSIVEGEVDKEEKEMDPENELQDKGSEKENKEEDEDLAFLDDDADINAMFLNEEEIERKTEVWMEENADYLEAQEAKQERERINIENGIVKKKTKRKPQVKAKIDANNPADATIQYLEQKKISKKINYSVLHSLFSNPFETDAKTKPEPQPDAEK